MSNVQETVESGTISVVPQLETISEEDLAARLFPDGTTTATGDLTRLRKKLKDFLDKQVLG